ncbi:MAG TPA: PilX N-terminal domain-containing pilus assembly protein [Burkholderiales bacterium]
MRRQQQGATLVIVLIMLVLMTLFVVSMVRLSNTNMRVVGNMQTQRSLEAAAQQAIEDKISTITFFNDAIAGTGTWPTATTQITVTVNSFNVTMKRPKCIYYQPAEGYSATSAISPEDTQWEIETAVDDSAVTGAKATVVQGVKMRLTAGSCA